MKTGRWKTVDDIAQRRIHSNSVVLIYNTFANRSNDYFHELCTDLNYFARVAVPVVGSEIKVRFMRCLFGKFSATSNEKLRVLQGISFWVWKEHAEILTPILSHIWNLSLRTHTWPMSW